MWNAYGSYLQDIKMKLEINKGIQKEDLDG